MARNPLKQYHARRDFSITPEPAGNKQKTANQVFVIQRHDASHRHYDVRLEINGVLVSWAVPKGPSLNPRIKRLAVQTEDHPLDYAHFEGVIPAGEYGAGTVMVWDIGTYENIKTKDNKPVAMIQCLKNGRIEIVLHGKKLQGAYALIRTDYPGRSGQWLLIKMKDEYTNARKNPITSQPKSALTGRTMQEIHEEAMPKKAKKKRAKKIK